MKKHFSHFNFYVLLVILYPFIFFINFLVNYHNLLIVISVITVSYHQARCILALKV